MRTIATTALLLTLIAVGATPAAAAHGDRYRGHLQDTREIRALARQIERATDELLRDARRAAGRVDRHEARALRAIHRLEDAADEFRRSLGKRFVSERPARREFRRLENAFQAAFHERRALLDDRRGREIRRDFRQLDRLMAEVEESFRGPRRHRAHRERSRVAYH